jgi:methionine-S-sulfoxide reductase
VKIVRVLLPLLFLLPGCSTSSTTAVAESGVKQQYLSQYSKVQDDKERMRHLDVGYFAGGCFWGVQDEFNRAPGVVSTIVGYCGGITRAPTYESVCRHGTKHAETVRVVYDPGKTTFKALTSYFLDIHDPTTVNRQGPDIGDQYRSAIFFEGEKQKEEALQAIESKNASLPKNSSVVTALDKFVVFYTAEDYHQNYISRTGDASCHVR